MRLSTPPYLRIRKYQAKNGRVFVRIARAQHQPRQINLFDQLLTDHTRRREE